MNIAPTIFIQDTLYIRQPQIQDIHDRFLLGRSVEFRKMVGGSTQNIPDYTMDNATNLYKREMNNPYSWFIVYQNKMIGVCRLKHINDKCVRYSIGIYDDTLYSKGIGTMVTKTVIEYAFTKLQYSQIELMVLAFNHRAIRCYEKCGFIQTKILPNNLEVDGRFYDDIIMTIDKDDWIKR